MSMPNSQFYRERTAATAQEARETPSPHVRARLLEVEKAWLTLAKGAAEFEKQRIRS